MDLSAPFSRAASRAFEDFPATFGRCVGAVALSCSGGLVVRWKFSKVSFLFTLLYELTRALAFDNFQQWWDVAGYTCHAPLLCISPKTPPFSRSSVCTCVFMHACMHVCARVCTYACACVRQYVLLQFRCVSTPLKHV